MLLLVTRYPDNQHTTSSSNTETTKQKLTMSSNYRDDETEEGPEEDVRLKAFALLNKIGRDEDDDETTWPEKPPPKEQLSSYQKPHKNAGTAQKDTRRRPPIQINPTNADHYEEWGIAGLMVSCIADACKKSTEYAARRGYESIYPDAREATGDFEKVSILNTYGVGSQGQSSGER